ncbi:MAG: alginate lyase family protein [Planctomycetota bacterium]|nr:alginate lyase family protein [Planctomycetota bacterium]
MRLAHIVVGACVLLVATVAAKAGAAPAAAPPRVFVLDAQTLAANRARVAAGDKLLAPAVEDLRKQADKALKAGPFSVMDKKDVPPSGDKHDYTSLAPYFWPDPTKPDGMPYIRKDGEVHPGRHEQGDAAAMGHMSNAVKELAWGWYFTGDERYAEHAAALLRAWFLDEKTRMNPNLNFAQAIPGITKGRGIGIIDTTHLIDLVDAVGLLAGSKAWTPADQKGIEAWFEKFVAWLQESKNGRDEAAAHNNHGTWYDAQLAAYALFAGKPDVAKKVLAESHKRIDKQIEPDGRQPLELERTKSWDYSVMNLHGWFTAATLGERVGVDLWKYQSPDGRSIRKALDYLVPFAKDPGQWQTKQIVKLKPEGLVSLLRLAAAKYGEKKYAEEAGRIAGDEKGGGRDSLLGLRP